MRDDSFLQQAVRNGLGAVRQADHVYYDQAIRSSFDDSLDFDEAMREGHEQENRWDYLLGHRPSGEIVAVEPHSAREDEISTVVKKLAAAKKRVQPHLKPGVKVARWLWVASGNVQFAKSEKTIFQLAQRNITFVGRKILAKHLAPGLGASQTGRRRRERRRGRRSRSR